MKRELTQNSLPPATEPISLTGTFRAKYRTFAIFLICCALLLASIAVSAVVLEGGEKPLTDRFLSLFEPDEDLNDLQNQGGANQEENPAQKPAEPPKSEETIPENATPIVVKNLSCASLGRLYLHNETPYAPDVSALLSRDLARVNPTDDPLVLILHTHTSEAYLDAPAAYLEGEIGDVTYSTDAARNVTAVGAELARALKENGITAIHCTVMHDVPALGGAYERSAETVRQYLEDYPTIRYVIDLHRDSVTTDAGELVRAVVGEGEAATAQVMAVVGSDANGTAHPNWEENLALALGLRELLNADGGEVCRPVFLRNASFYQELAPHSILLEIGTSGNSLDEAKRAARLVGDALANLIYER